METKIFEIRDRATFIPALAIRLQTTNKGEDIGLNQEIWLLRRAGYALKDLDNGRFIILVTLASGVGKAICDPYDWASDTLTPAHDYIARHWDELTHGQVIDAEFIRGESAAPKQSERITEGSL